MPTGEQFATNVPQTFLASPVAAAATSIPVLSSSSWPSTPFTATFGIGTSLQEAIHVTNVSGTTWTVTRGYDGTVAQNQPLNQTVTHTVIGLHLRELRSHIDASGPTDASGEGVHGLTTGAVVGTSESQTLTNKTITSPSIQGTVGGSAAYTSPTLNTPTVVGSGGTLTLPAGPDTLVARATTDTLTNKTLTSPTINGGALSGTFSGAHTYSGLATYNAGATIATGQVLTVDNVAVKPIVGPVEQAYTPTFGGSGATLGNGTIQGNYVQYGKITFVEIKVLFGSTSTFATSGATTLTLPNTPTTAGILEGFYLQGGNLWRIMGLPTSFGSNTVEILAASGNTAGVGGLSVVTGTVPTAQSASTLLYFRGWYQSTT